MGSLCVGLDAAQAAEQLGPAQCDSEPDGGSTCQWPNGLGYYTYQELGDQTHEIATVYVSRPWNSKSPGTLAPGDLSACFSAALGPVDYAIVVKKGDEYRVNKASWSSGIAIDAFSLGSEHEAAGVIEVISLTKPF